MNAVPNSAETVTAEVERLFKVLTSAEGQANPYPVYAQLRAIAPVYVDSDTALLTRYDDISAIIRNPALGAQSPAWMDRIRPDWRDHPGLVATHESFVFRDPPDHTRLRRHVSADFSPGKVRKWQDYISTVTTEVLDEIESTGADGSPVDLHEILATKLPIRVISKIMGVPEDDHPLLRTPLEGLRLAADGSPASKLPVIDKAGQDLLDYFADLAAKRRQAPRDDLVTSLAAVRDTGGGPTGRSGADRGGDAAVADADLQRRYREHGRPAAQRHRRVHQPS